MKPTRKLLIQITRIILPVFVLMIAGVAWTIYISSVRSYLEAQKKQMVQLMEDTWNYLPFENDSLYGTDEVRQWVMDEMGSIPIEGDFELTEEELDAINEIYSENPELDIDFHNSLSEDLKRIYFKESFFLTQMFFEESTISSSFDALIYVNASQIDQARILIDFDGEDSENRNGEFLAFDISQHPVLQELFDNNSQDTVFEQIKDFPSEGNYFICYRPVMISGKVHSVIGLAYEWDDLRSSVIHIIINAVVIIVSGMIFLMAVLLLFLYFRAIRPVTSIRTALVNYTEDKSTPNIVREMYGIKAKNELGFLADTISDLALEIDHYTKENVRIAVAQERTEKELYEAKVSVMASQIQPHFMYNALTSIAMMCTIDPPTAQEATITFAKYLRGNMDSLKQNRPVPFAQELEHLKKYLYIEKLRFGDKLNIEYDITATVFKLPMLSVQPLVENAVKHGVGMKKKGGTVKISTRETETAYMVIVSDDGVGFDPSAPRPDDGRSHVGMDNTRMRLKEMCGGEIKIKSTVGEGTTATIILPKDRQTEEDTGS